ncbi:MAG: MFS transporter [Candidatus Kryptoniota bacterium]
MTVLMYISFGLLTSVIGVIIDRFQAEYSLPLQIAALLPFAFYLSYGLFSIPFGVAMDKWGARYVLLLGLFLMAAGSFLFYLSNQYMIVILMIFIIGIGVTAVQTAGNPFIRELDKPERYTANLTTIIGIGALGYAVSPLLVPIVETNGFSWNSVYLFFGFLNLLLLLLIYFAKFPDVHLSEEEKIRVSQVGALIKNPIILAYTLGIFLYVSGEVGTSSYIVIFMNKIHNVTSEDSFWKSGTILHSAFPSKSALVVGLFWLFQALGRLAIAPMMKFLGERRLFVFHSLGTVVMLAVAIIGSTTVSLVAFSLVGYFTCASFTSIFSAAINSFETNHGTISGILGTAIVGGAFGGWLVGAAGGMFNMKWGMVINMIAFTYVFGLAVWGKGKLDLQPVQTEAEHDTLPRLEKSK